MSRDWRAWGTLAAALLFFNISLSFSNYWPTPLIIWTGQLSIELMVGLLLLMAVGRRSRQPSRAMLTGIGLVCLVLIAGRYFEVTADALYGRPFNAYWDVRYLPDVASMLVRALPWWLILVIGLTLGLLLFAFLWILRRATGRLFAAAGSPTERRVLAAFALAAILVFAAQRLIPAFPAWPVFPTPASATYARQFGLLTEAMTGATSIPPAVPLTSDLRAVQGADVLLVFVESYGAVSWERSDLSARLAEPREEFDTAIRDTGREIVSAYVESPTFGGSSWFAHLSLMSGVEVKTPDTNALLMTQKRDSIVTAFSRQGYRTVALMPGLWYPWPEGNFYGFDTIYGGEQLGYHGPEFGWWTIPDQFTMARLDELELNRPTRAPLFVFFPTVSSHTPFSPTPPYQPDWKRIVMKAPWDLAVMDEAYSHFPDWSDLSPGYGNALAYAYQMFAGYLRQHADRDLVMILIGDHQPPAAVSGEGMTWNVPVHVIASRKAVLDQLMASGFRQGLKPDAPAVTKMHALLPVLLNAFN